MYIYIYIYIYICTDDMYCFSFVCFRDPCEASLFAEDKYLKEVFGDIGGLSMVEAIFDQWGDGYSDIPYHTVDGGENILE